jgi:hypothetical protein
MPRVRWFVPAETVRALLTGAETATVFARIVVGGEGFLAAAPVPGVPAGALRAPGLGSTAHAGDAPGAGMAPGGTDAGTGEGAVETPGATLPSRVELRAALPLRPGGTLEFGLPRPGPARVTLHSATGRRVAELARGTYEAGWHRLVVPAAVQSGVYFLSLETEDARSNRKVLILP